MSTRYNKVSTVPLPDITVLGQKTKIFNSKENLKMRRVNKEDIKPKEELSIPALSAFEEGRKRLAIDTLRETHSDLTNEQFYAWIYYNLISSSSR